MTKIEGVPDGWEPVAFDFVNEGESYLTAGGCVYEWRGDKSTSKHLKVRRAEPHCTWAHGVFKDGWIAEDEGGFIGWYPEKPVVGKTNKTGWVNDSPVDTRMYWLQNLLNPPVFRSSLPWTERIQQVGPTFEATLRGET